MNYWLAEKTEFRHDKAIDGSYTVVSEYICKEIVTDSSHDEKSLARFFPGYVISPDEHITE